MIVGVRRHLTVRDLHLYQGCPRPHLIIGFELHRADTALSMADNTVLVDDASYLSVVAEILTLRLCGEGECYE